MKGRMPQSSSDTAMPAGDSCAADRLKALGHPVRLAIIQALARRTPCSCGDFFDSLPLAQSTISQHLKILKDAGLICLTREGTRSRYSLDAQALAETNRCLDAIAVGAGRQGEVDDGER
jgi:DNA-binding transcriptional ArsR family regulator